MAWQKIPVFLSVNSFMMCLPLTWFNSDSSEFSEALRTFNYFRWFSLLSLINNFLLVLRSLSNSVNWTFFRWYLLLFWSLIFISTPFPLLRSWSSRVLILLREGRQEIKSKTQYYKDWYLPINVGRSCGFTMIIDFTIEISNLLFLYSASNCLK